MLSLRSVARSAPRAAARLTSQSALRTASFGAARLAARPTISSFQPKIVSAFSTSPFVCAPANSEVDSELSAKLESEIQFETEIRENEPEATSVKDFLESGLFEIEDVPGREEVVLRRTYGAEKISVTFSVADLSNYNPDLFEEDDALADGEESGDIDAAAKAEKAAPGSGAEEEAEDDLDATNPTAVPCRLSIVVEKPGQGALSVEATAQDGSLMVDNLYYYKDAAHAHESTAEVAHAAQKVYPGPVFGSLDEDLQVLLDRYLEERGITQALAVFVPDYLDAKEQREYLGFLQNLKTFVDA